MDLEEQAKQQFEKQQQEHDEKMRTDPSYKAKFEKTQASLLSDPKIQALLQEADNARTHKHLEPGSAEAKAKGCSCEAGELRDEKCTLHAYTSGEMLKAAQKLEDARERKNED